MIRGTLTTALIAVALIAGNGCGNGGVGDPCTISEPPGDDGGTGTFQGGEVYIETQSLQCRTRVCMIYKWAEAMDMTSQSLHEFCTCKCGGPGDPTTFCSCPSNFACISVFSAGAQGIRGNYCVSTLIPGVGDGGTTGGGG